ncbi:MAG TPA: ABC transporter permease [Steroidobacteraceae bacterium]|nr:ABC transporter permease [Steroidobacteraceae bacterium]
MLTALMIIAIGVGIGASMTMLTIFRAASGDPIPQKSAQLFNVQIDSYGPQPGVPLAPDFLPYRLDYIDALALMRAHRAPRQVAMYPISVDIAPPDSQRDPVQANGHATYGDFFPMFDVPFEYGGSWGSAEDQSHAPVVVLTRRLNDQLFGGADSVGRTVTIEGDAYRVMGVMQTWRPTPPFYDLGSGGGRYTADDEFFLPFARAIDQHWRTAGGFGCPSRAGIIRGWDGMLTSPCVWIALWVELPTAGSAAQYRAFLHNYADSQRQSGRFNWPARVALRDVSQWLDYNHVVPPALTTLTGVSFAVLIVCLLNAAGLMLAKFMARIGSVALRRALGATRPAIYAQCLMEAAMIGVAGAIVGIGLSETGLITCRRVLPDDFAILTHLRTGDILIALLLAVFSALAAGLYPIWRTSRVAYGAALTGQ